jgi:hypothetical protein
LRGKGSGREEENEGSWKETKQLTGIIERNMRLKRT